MIPEIRILPIILQLILLFHPLRSQNVRNFIRVVSTSQNHHPPKIIIRSNQFPHHPHHHYDGHHSIGNSLHDLLSGSGRDGHFRRGISSLLQNSRSSSSGLHGVGDYHLIEELLQNGHHHGLEVGDLRNLIQQGRGTGGGGSGGLSSLLSGSTSGLNSGGRGLQNLFQNGRGGAGSSLGLFGQGPSTGIGGGILSTRRGGPWMQLFLDKTRFFGMGTRLLVHQGRLLSELFGHVIHGVGNITDRVMGTGGEGENSGNLQQLLGRLPNNLDHGSVVNYIDIITPHHQHHNAHNHHHGGHLHGEYHHHPLHHRHEHEPNGQEYHHRGQEELPTHDESLPNSSDDDDNQYNDEKRKLEEAYQSGDEGRQGIDPNIQEIDHHYKNEHEPQDFNDAAAANQIHDESTTTGLFRVLKIPPFKPMPDWNSTKN